MNNPLISVVTPEYKGAGMIPEFCRRNIAALSQITDNFEIIMVNDGSPDDTWQVIQKECSRDKRVKGINLSRNFGQHYAISAGLVYATGAWVVVMDCDLQDRPEEIPNLYSKAQQGFDIVFAKRVSKQFGFFKKLSSKLYHSIFDWLSGYKTDESIGNFGIYSFKVVKEFNKMPERVRFLGSQIEYLGFTRTAIDVAHNERAEGKSSYTLHKLLSLAFNVILSNSNKPLKMSVRFGFMVSLLAFLLAIYNIIAKWAGIIIVQGYTTTVFSIWFVGGLILMMLGILGLYIGKIFDQVKGRQIFIVKDKINL